MGTRRIAHVRAAARDYTMTASGQTTSIPVAFYFVGALATLVVAVAFALADRKGWLRPPRSSRTPIGIGRTAVLFLALFGIVALLGLVEATSRSPDEGSSPQGETVLLVVLVAAIVAMLAVLAGLGRRNRRLGGLPPGGFDDRERKLEILRRFEGRSVVLGVGLKGFVPDRGILWLEGDDAVILDHPKSGRRRLIRLSDVRSLTDPETGTQVGGPW